MKPQANSPISNIMTFISKWSLVASHIPFLEPFLLIVNCGTMSMASKHAKQAILNRADNIQYNAVALRFAT